MSQCILLTDAEPSHQWYKWCEADWWANTSFLQMLSHHTNGINGVKLTDEPTLASYRYEPSHQWNKSSGADWWANTSFLQTLSHHTNGINRVELTDGPTHLSYICSAITPMGSLFWSWLMSKHILSTDAETSHQCHKWCEADWWANTSFLLKLSHHTYGINGMKLTDEPRHPSYRRWSIAPME